MKITIILKIFTGIIILLLLIKFLTTLIVDPWLGKKIQSVLEKKNINYRIDISKVHLLIFSRGIEIRNILLTEKEEQAANTYFKGTVGSLKIKGMHLFKALLRNDIAINEVSITDCYINGNIPFESTDSKAIVSPAGIRVDRLFIDKVDLELEDCLTAKSYLVKEGMLRFYNLQLDKQDTFSIGMVKKFDFKAANLASVSSDSLYSFLSTGVYYSSATEKLVMEDFTIHPNYTIYDFTSRSKYQTDCIEGDFSKIYIHDFDAADFLVAGNIRSTYIEIGQMELKVFRDLRKEFLHVKKPVFQEIIYNYPGKLRIDSIRLFRGNIAYTEHVRKANEAGRLSFNEISADIYNLTNDTLYKTKNASLILNADALLMGKGKLNIDLKVRLFDPSNTFLLNGTLSEMEAGELNPFLEKNAFMYITSGIIDKMEFSFTANNTKSNGLLTLNYQGMEITMKNSETDETSGFKERFISYILNRKVLNSNPMENEKARVGIIEYERDPERSFFNYCAKSILTGIKSSLLKNPEKNEKNKKDEKK